MVLYVRDLFPKLPLMFCPVFSPDSQYIDFNCGYRCNGEYVQ